MKQCFGKGNYLPGAAGSRHPGTASGQPAAAAYEPGDRASPLVATNDVHYTYAEDAEAHDILLCIQTGKEAGGRGSYAL